MRASHWILFSFVSLIAACAGAVDTSSEEGEDLAALSKACVGKSAGTVCNAKRDRVCTADKRCVKKPSVPVNDGGPAYIPPGKEGGMCAGFAGIVCDAGLTCDLGGKTYPDAAGICKKASTPQPGKEGGMCAGFAGIVCDAGLTCDLGGKTYPDASGVCRKTSASLSCGSQNCDGLKTYCEVRYPGIVLPDAGGTTLYSCKPLPNACLNDISCACVSPGPANGSVQCSKTSGGIRVDIYSI